MTFPWQYASIAMVVTQEECNMIIEHRNAIIRKEIEELEVKNKKLQKAINRKSKALNQPPEFDVSDDEDDIHIDLR